MIKMTYPFCYCPEINEICLFKVLNRYLNDDTNSIFAKETHGAKGLVKFNQNNGSVAIKEIADLQILCYDSVNSSIKISFLQAKFNRSNHNRSRISSFKGDALQWDLLKYRPIFESVGSINFPDDILNNSSYLSIGGFGVFYFWDSDTIDFVYSTASELSPRDLNYSRRRCERVIYPLNGFNDNKTPDETLVRDSMNGYIDSLLKFEIGSPVLVNSSTAAYVSNLLSNMQRSEDFEGAGGLLEMMSNALGGDQINDRFNNEGFINTLLIKSNSDNRKG